MTKVILIIAAALAAAVCFVGTASAGQQGDGCNYYVVQSGGDTFLLPTLQRANNFINKFGGVIVGTENVCS